MKISFKITCFLSILYLSLPFIQAQEYGVIRLLCSPRPDSILLRWAPADRATWQLGNRYGYVVERHTMMRNGKLLDDMPKTILTVQALKPRPIAEWEPYQENRYVSIAAECLFNRDSLNTGGNPHLVARRYKEEQNRFSFALYAADHSIIAARLSGLYLVDKTARKDEKYLYRVYIPVPETEIFKADTASAFSGISEYQPLPEPVELKARWNDKTVELSWNIQYLNHIYNSYVIEKSTDGERYTPLSDRATVQLADQGVSPTRAYKTDTLDNNKTTYYYRVRGLMLSGKQVHPANPFGKRTYPYFSATRNYRKRSDRQPENTVAMDLSRTYEYLYYRIQYLSIFKTRCA